MFDDENDFIEKCKYYLENPLKRKKIVNQAFDDFVNKHKWENSITTLLNVILNYNVK